MFMLPTANGAFDKPAHIPAKRSTGGRRSRENEFAGTAIRAQHPLLVASYGTDRPVRTMDRELTTMTGPRVLEATRDRRHTLGRWLAAGACTAVLAACGGGGKKHAVTATTTTARTTIPTTTTTLAPVNYKVVRGDTLGKIARKFGVSISAITDANKITDPDKIVEGQVLVIPAASSTTTTRAGQSPGPSTSRGAVPGTTSTTKR